MKRQTQRRLRATVAIVAAAALALVIAPHPTETEASWVDSEVGNATFNAITVPTPQSTGACVAAGGLLGVAPTVTVPWKVPDGLTGYTVLNAEFGQMTGGLLLPLTSVLLGNMTTTGTPTAYTTVASGGLLGTLLGGTAVISIRFIGPGGWKSPWLVASASMALAGLNPKCELSVAPSVD